MTRRGNNIYYAAGSLLSDHRLRHVFCEQEGAIENNACLRLPFAIAHVEHALLIEEGRIKAAFDSGVFVLKLCGDVRLTLCATLDTQAQRLAETPGLRAVLIDLREATNVDSTALGFLAKVAMAVKGRLE